MDSLYSALVIDADKGTLGEYALFSYSQAQNVMGSDQVATASYTNVPRSGWNGLPQGWDFYVSRWRVQTNLRIDEPLMDWAAESTARLIYNNRPITTRPVLDLLMAPHDFYVAADLDPDNELPASFRGGPMPLWMREAIAYEVRIQVNDRATQELQTYLMEHTRGHRLILWVYLDGILRKGVR